VSQDLGLVAGSAGGAPVSGIEGWQGGGRGYRPSGVQPDDRRRAVQNLLAAHRLLLTWDSF
jgi:hypothetical protein